MRVFRDLMIGMLCLCLGIATVHVIKIFQNIEYDLNTVSAQVYYIGGSVHDLIGEIQKVVVTTNATLVEVRGASEDERIALQSQNKRILDVLDQTETALINLQSAVDDIDKNTGKVSEASVAAVTQLQPLLIESTNSIKAAGVLLSDPKLTQTAANLASSTEHISQMTAHLEHTTDQIDHKVEEMLKPASLIKRIAGEVLGWVAHIGDLRQAFGK
jgi:hypothetical protein